MRGGADLLEFQYFDGCPNAAITLESIRELITEKLIQEELKITEIKDISEAEELNFQGSPTVLYEGIDIYTEEVPTSFNYSCRVYVIKGKQTGVLDQEFILNKIKKLKDFDEKENKQWGNES